MTDTDLTWSRHHATRAGEDFADALWLEGYDDQSIWGYDTGVNSFFAQLWSNGSRSEAPDLWLTPPDLWASWPHVLIPPIVEFTDATSLAVVRALGIARPNPRAIDTEQLLYQRDVLAGDERHAYVRGQVRGLDWMLGRALRAPASGEPSDLATPDPAIVDAESAYATGLVYLTGSTEVVGIEDALISAIRS